MRRRSRRSRAARRYARRSRVPSKLSSSTPMPARRRSSTCSATKMPKDGRSGLGYMLVSTRILIGKTDAVHSQGRATLAEVSRVVRSSVLSPTRGVTHPVRPLLAGHRGTRPRLHNRTWGRMPESDGRRCRARGATSSDLRTRALTGRPRLERLRGAVEARVGTRRSVDRPPDRSRMKVFARRSAGPHWSLDPSTGSTGQRRAALRSMSGRHSHSSRKASGYCDVYQA